MRVMMYAPGIGLGHIRRAYNIAREVLKREPRASALIVTDARVAHAYPPVAGLDYLKLPSIKKVERTTWVPESIGLDLDDLVALRSRLLLEAFRMFLPDVVVVDHRPVGVEGELKPLLIEAAKRAPRTRLYLGLRDILDDPQVIWGLWDRYGAREFLDGYDAILIYGQPDIYDLPSTMGLTSLAPELAWTGYVAPPLDGEVSAGSKRPLILMTGGAGDDALPVAEAFVKALPRILGAIDAEAVVVTGPGMPTDKREELRSAAPRQRVRIETSVEDATTLVRRASAIVTMCGYNSSIEALRWSKKALVVPRPGPSEEQRTRARLFAERSLIRVLDPDDLSPERLADGVLQLLDDDGVPDVSSIPRLDGAEQAAAVLVDGKNAGSLRVPHEFAVASSGEGE